MSIFVDDLDALHGRCVNAGLEITHPPTRSLGESARCTSAIPTDTSFGSAQDRSEVSRCGIVRRLRCSGQAARLVSGIR